jgi:hypothetical protein
MIFVLEYIFPNMMHHSIIAYAQKPLADTKLWQQVLTSNFFHQSDKNQSIASYAEKPSRESLKNYRFSLYQLLHFGKVGNCGSHFLKAVWILMLRADQMQIMQVCLPSFFEGA